MRSRTLGVLGALGIPLLLACSSEVAPAPPPVSIQAACILSADCPAGTHCDLGECIQECNDRDPCSGERTCSPRARCLPEGTPDVDPVPTGQAIGALGVSPKDVTLSERDDGFDLELSGPPDQLVKYRIETTGPHLSVDEPRGEMTGKKKVRIKVGTKTLTGRDVSGSVRVFTSLGTTVVRAPIHVGLTGRYAGSVRISSSAASLGDARLTLDLIEKNGDVIALAGAPSLTVAHGGFGRARTC